MSVNAKTQFRVWPGRPVTLGATWDGRGVNFALFSDNAERVELCLFDSKGRKEEARIPLPEQTDGIWHGYLPDGRPGMLYGYRVYGPYDPQRGHRFNHNKLLVDPYAKALYGDLIHNSANYGYREGHPRGDLSFDRRDNARFIPKGVVIDPSYTKDGDLRTDTPWPDTVIYEAHVKGMTMRHPDVPEEDQGTFSGLSAPAIIDHMTSLGVTTLELLPVQAFVDEPHLVDKGLTNYWGYNTFCFFTPAPRYLGGQGIDAFRTMVRRMHDAGIEVILDVVYNHTAEGNHMGPTLNFRGIDNASYYRLMPGDQRHYDDVTGCGNTLNLSHPRVLQMVMDSLRYWMTEMHVDGFRFDLAVTLTRGPDGTPMSGGASPFMSAVRQDPVLCRAKLIAEPWDLGYGGYRLGGFMPGWSEWNDRYRDTMRAFWKGEGGVIGDVANCLSGSSQIFEHQSRRPRSSINFITAHDGYTLEDLVSYETKRNQANGENNRDGTDNNRSWNCGAEGPTDDADVLALRARQKRNLMATLMLSQGVPMITAGDELGRSQGGNNNAYCQDNEISWLDWSMERDEDRDFLEFVRGLLRLRRRHPVFRRTRFFHGTHIGDSAVKDVTWLSPEGGELRDEQWRLHYARCFGFQLGGDTGEYYSRSGQSLIDDRFIVLMNADREPLRFKLPGVHLGRLWRVILDTARPEPGDHMYHASEDYPMEGRSLVVLVRRNNLAVEDVDPGQHFLPFDPDPTSTGDGN
ncbi:MAG: glycogen debranching protein GlgX [Rhodobacterales bacterium]|nr:glycogen debranching protein GlgX [Rhodobacterales bacterium]